MSSEQPKLIKDALAFLESRRPPAPPEPEPPKLMDRAKVAAEKLKDKISRILRPKRDEWGLGSIHDDGPKPGDPFIEWMWPRPDHEVPDERGHNAGIGDAAHDRFFRPEPANVTQPAPADPIAMPSSGTPKTPDAIVRSAFRRG